MREQYWYEEVLSMATQGKYLITTNDILLLGWLCAKNDWHKKRLKDIQDDLIPALQEYDKTDPLELMDTAGEIFIDLQIINNDKGEL